jgi:hypothetical protein
MKFYKNIHGFNKLSRDENIVIEPITIPTIPTSIAKRRNFFCFAILYRIIFLY